MGTRKQFTPEFKREAIQLLESGSLPGSGIARELGIARNQPYILAKLGSATPKLGSRLVIIHFRRMKNEQPFRGAWRAGAFQTLPYSTPQGTLTSFSK